eukprot:GILK01013656.1.p1 GENE.GILK01013656.1~~GILK01013656.1.p1  ORF type:complete len:269 (-),score=0.96 GILK01013656.1:2-808(-)
MKSEAEMAPSLGWKLTCRRAHREVKTVRRFGLCKNCHQRWFLSRKSESWKTERNRRKRERVAIERKKNEIPKLGILMVECEPKEMEYISKVESFFTEHPEHNVTIFKIEDLTPKQVSRLGKAVYNRAVGVGCELIVVVIVGHGRPGVAGGYTYKIKAEFCPRFLLKKTFSLYHNKDWYTAAVGLGPKVQVVHLASCESLAESGINKALPRCDRLPSLASSGQRPALLTGYSSKVFVKDSSQFELKTLFNWFSHLNNPVTTLLTDERTG